MVEQRERFRVAWVDTDTGGRIHFTAAFRWAEVTETSLYRRLGLLRGELADFPRRHVEADYLGPPGAHRECDVAGAGRHIEHALARRGRGLLHESSLPGPVAAIRKHNRDKIVAVSNRCEEPPHVLALALGRGQPIAQRLRH